MKQYKFKDQIFDTRNSAEIYVDECYNHCVFDDYLDGTYGKFKFFDTEYSASRLLKGIDDGIDYYDYYSNWLKEHYLEIEVIEKVGSIESFICKCKSCLHRQSE